MEVSWVSFLIILYSRSAAVNIDKSNSSIFDDFYLLDKDMQLEICNMIKETNTSTEFTLEERMQVKKDFCDQLEALDNREIEKNLLLVDDERSSGSDISDQISSVGSTPNSEVRDGSTASDLPKELISDQGISGHLSPKIEENLQSTSEEGSSTSLTPEHSKSSETFRFLITSQNSNSSWKTSASSSPSEASTLETVTLVTPKDTIIIAVSPNQSSTELPGNFNRREIILNSNTPMIPDPTYPNEELNPLNSLELIDLDEHSSELSIMNYSAKNDQVTNASKDNEDSYFCNENKNKKESSMDKNSKSIPYLNHKKCSKCSKKSSNTTVNKAEDRNYDLETPEETRIDNSQKSKLPCLTCSTARFFQSTKNSTTKLENLEVTPSEMHTSGITTALRTTNATYTTRELDPCSKCWSSTVSSTTSENPSYDSFCLKYCSSESSTNYIDPSSDISTNPPPPSEDFETSYDTPIFSSDNTEIITDSIHTTTEFNPRQCESSSTLLYETLITNSTPYFCGSSAQSQHQFYNNTTSSGSSSKPICNPNQLIVNPKSPRKSRRLTKILSALGKLHSYAGFFKVDQQSDTRLFFWFFCNQKWKHTPLIVWLQGEPGLSSLHGLFQEHGPYYLEHTENGFDMKLRKFSWTKEYSVLYLDHCVGCGFSSSKDHQAYIPSYGQVARNVYQGLSQFFKIWYEMVPNDLYLAGSYGGAKYIPVIAQTIHNGNKNRICSQKMNLKGLLIGGPYVDSGVMVNYNDFFLANGIIDEVGHKDMIPMQYHAQELIRAGKYQDAIDFLNLHVYCLMSQAGYEVYRDVRYLKETQEENMQNVVQSEEFKRMVCMHDINFEIKSDILVEEIMPSVDTLVSELLHHYKILYYNGQFDLMAPYMLTSKALLKLEWESIDQFYTTEIVNWYPKKDSDSCPEGYFRSYRNLTHVMIRNSGHFVGTTNSRSLYYLLKWFVEDKFQRYHDNENWYK